jgi:putative drug exporter of the RND superfamily
MAESSVPARQALARALVRGRWWVLAGWGIVGALAATRATAVANRLDVRGGSLRPNEASRVDAALATRFRHDVGETFVVIVSGPSPREPLDSLCAQLRREPYVRDVEAVTGDSGGASRDPRTAIGLVTLRRAPADSVLQLVDTVRAALRRTLARLPLPDGAAYRVLVTGDTPLERDMLTATTDDVARSERRLVPVAALILLVAFGSLVAAALPLVIGFGAIVVALAVIGALAGVMPMSIYVLNVATMIGLGVGIDYSLLVVTRFREEREGGAPVSDAIARTLATAGAAVATSGLCVALGFAALLFTPLIETRSIGVGGLVVVAVAVMMTLTLLPALLAVLGTRIGRRAPSRERRLWERWAGAVVRHPGWALGAGAAILVALSAPIGGIRIGLPARHWWPAATEAGAGLDALARMGGAGDLQPLRVLVEWPPETGRGATDPAALRGLRVLSDSLRGDPRVRLVRSLVDLRPHTSLLQYQLLYSDLDAVRARTPGALDAFLSTDGHATRLDVVLDDTTSLLSAMDVVHHARRLAAGRALPLAGARVAVGGYVAQNVDLQDSLLARLPLLVGLVLATTAVMLGLVFRSLLVPLKAIVLNVLAASATLGLIVLLFQRGADGTGAVFVAVPVLVFAVVFGLSMDYEVFLLSRIKEAFDAGGDNDRALVDGLGATAGVITSAALLMIAVFAAFAFARVLVIRLLGFGLAAAVLLDATVIRLVLVPALMRLAGRWNWWPGARARGGSA